MSAVHLNIWHLEENVCCTFHISKQEHKDFTGNTTYQCEGPFGIHSMRGLGPDLLVQVFSKNNRKRLGNGAGCRSDFLYVNYTKRAVVLILVLDVIIS